jgi:AcrR family transcriptional regulator
MINHGLFCIYEQELYMSGKRPSGRPANQDASTALKAVALRLVRELGYEKISVSEIIEQAGVARQTLYNRWNTKADLVLEAVFEQTNTYAAEPSWDGAEDCRTLLEGFLIRIFEHLRIDGDTLRALITAVLRRAQDRGELSPGRNVETLSALIHGAFWYRLLNRGVLDAGFAKEIVAETFA